MNIYTIRMLKPQLIIAALSIACMAASATAQIRIENAWVRATVAGQQSTGAFMKITSTEPVKLLRVRTPFAKTNEIHEMKMEGDVMKMRAWLGGLDIPANKTVELRSGGYHLMMMELDQPIKAGSTVSLQFQFINLKGNMQEINVNAKASFKDPYK